jgi:epoxyqueuosine reductase
LNLEEEIESKLKEWGATFVGFSNVLDKLPEPLKKYPYAITFGLRLSDAIVDEIDNKPTYTYFNHYRSLNALIDQINLRLLLYIQEKGYNAYSVAASQTIPDAPESHSGMFPHKTGAVMSGLGWMGKSGLFIHKDFGPRVRLGTVLTDMTLPFENVLLESQCVSCNKCVKACPAMALTGEEWRIGMKREVLFDAKACAEYMNKHFKHIGRGSVCGICIKVCK